MHGRVALTLGALPAGALLAVPAMPRGTATAAEGAGPLRAPAKGLIADHPLTGSGATVPDTSGNGHDATVHGDVTRTAEHIESGGTNGHVRLPDDLMAVWTHQGERAGVERSGPADVCAVVLGNPSLPGFNADPDIV